MTGDAGDSRNWLERIRCISDMAPDPVMEPGSPKKRKVCFKWYLRASLRE